MSENPFLPPRWRLALGASLPPLPRGVGSPPALPPDSLAEGGGGGTEAASPRLGQSPRAAAQPPAPGPAGQCAARRPRLRRLRRLLPARCLPLLPPSLPAPRLHARPPPPPPRGERRPHSLVPRALLAAAARPGTAAGPRPAERTRPGTRTPPLDARPALLPRLRRAPEPGRCAAARPQLRARHRALPRGGGSSPGPPWAPSGSGSRRLLGITLEASAVTAKFPEEARLPGRCAGRAGCTGRGSGSARPGQDARAGGAGAGGPGAVRRHGVRQPGFAPERRETGRPAFGIWGGGP